MKHTRSASLDALKKQQAEQAPVATSPQQRIELDVEAQGLKNAPRQEAALKQPFIIPGSAKRMSRKTLGIDYD